MCGIAGVLDITRSTSGPELEAAAAAMAAPLCHRGPDDEGTWSDPAGGCGFGHRRLAILDLSHHGHQPMMSPDGRWVLVFNGEIYNFRELRARLEPSGWPFASACDTEVLLAAVATWGVARTLDRLNGMFAFAVWDRQRRALHLVRDRLGEKPLYWAHTGNTVLFGSELKALRAHPGFAPDVDPAGVAAFLHRGFVAGGRSIYRSVWQLPPGGVLTVAADGTVDRPRRYWSVRDVAARGLSDQLDEGEAAGALDRLLRDAVRLRMVADVPLGAFLSGGIDSSLVVALMQDQATRPVRTFTVGFDEDSVDEARHAAAVAGHLGTDHTEIRLTPAAAREVIPRLPEIYDEPFADPSQIPTALMCRHAREHVTVALSGDGGDEVFGGYNRYVLTRSLWQRVGWIPQPLRVMAGRALQRVPHRRLDEAAARLTPLLPAGLRQRDPGGKLEKLARVLPARDEQAVFRMLTAVWEHPEAVVRNSDGFPADGAGQLLDLGDPLHAMILADSETTLPDCMLTKVDRASMAASLEVRVPLLDHRVMELAWRLPVAAKVTGGQGKRVLREVLYRYVPRGLVERPKMGFDPPIGAWLTGPLRGWAEDLLAPRHLAASGMLDPGPIRRCWAEHLAGRRNHDYALWAVLMYRSWEEAHG